MHSEQVLNEMLNARKEALLHARHRSKKALSDVIVAILNRQKFEAVAHDLAKEAVCTFDSSYTKAEKDKMLAIKEKLIAEARRFVNQTISTYAPPSEDVITQEVRELLEVYGRGVRSIRENGGQSFRQWLLGHEHLNRMLSTSINPMLDLLNGEAPGGAISESGGITP